MKKQLLACILLLFSVTQIKAQFSAYYPFPDSNALWNEKVVGYNDSCDINEYYILAIYGDTTIGANMYQKIVQTGYSYSAICDSDTTFYYDSVYVAAIRQNIPLKEVYIIPKDSSAEILLYDFNLSVGDTLPATYTGQGNYNYVLAVDSVPVGSNYRKNFAIGLLDSISSYVSLVEGIGSSFGLISPLAPPSIYTYSLNCFSQNGQTLYPDTSSSCNSLMSVKEVLPERFISLYPNPASDELLIDGSWSEGLRTPSEKLETGNQKLTIINVLGETIFTEEINRKPEKVNCKFFPAGIYFVLLTADNERWMGRFVKE